MCVCVCVWYHGGVCVFMLALSLILLLQFCFSLVMLEDFNSPKIHTDL